MARTCSLGWALAAPQQGVQPVVVAVQRLPLPVKWAQVVRMVLQALPWQAQGLLVAVASGPVDAVVARVP